MLLLKEKDDSEFEILGVNMIYFWVTRCYMICTCLNVESPLCIYFGVLHLGVFCYFCNDYVDYMIIWNYLFTLLPKRGIKKYPNLT